MSLDQFGYRFGADDGSESAHGWLDAENTSVALPLDTKTLLRVGIQCYGGAPASSKYALEFKKTTDSAWREVINTGSLAVMLAPTVGSPNNIPHGGEATTNRLTAPAGSPTPTFTAGRRWADESAQDEVAIGNNQFTELEFGIMAVSANGAVNGDVYDFRVVRIPAAAGGGGFAHIASVFTAGTQDGVTSGAIDTTGANLIVIDVGWYNAVTANGTLTDSKTNTWTPLTTRTQGGMSNRLFYCVPTSVGSGHTFSYNGTQIYPAIGVRAYSGAHASPFDQENGAAAPNANTIQPGSITPPQDGCLVVSGTTYTSAATVSVNSSYTILGQTGYTDGVHVGAALAYIVQGSAGALNPTWDWGETVNEIAASAASFKPA